MGFSDFTKIFLVIILLPFGFFSIFYLALEDTFVGYLLSDLSTSLSAKFASLFANSLIVLIISLIIISSFTLYNPIKEFQKSIILKRSILCIVIFIIALIPFYRGCEFNRIEDLGFRLVSYFDGFHTQNKKYPEDLSKIQINLSPDEENFLSENFRYKISSSGNYELFFVPNDHGMMRYYYNRHKNSFEGMD